VIIFLPIIAWWLTRNVNSDQATLLKLPDAGQWRTEEKRVLWIFLLTALAWITRSEPLGGWSVWLGVPQANDAAIALSAAILLFIVPGGQGKNLLTWQQASDIPWGILLLFAGGICIAKAFVVSGLSVTVGEAVSILTTLPLFLMLLILCFSVSIMTESTSNMATTLLLMPILAAAALVADIDPKLLMLPAALSASCAFMLPVATAPNAIAFASGRVASVEMFRAGIVLNIWGAFIIAGLCYFLVN
jgi:sodium-dependent dicarboxylate transporter 2/3/5